MTADQLFKMSYEEFGEAIKRESQIGEENSFNHDPETFDQQVEEFGKFKQSKESIRHLLSASDYLDRNK